MILKGKALLFNNLVTTFYNQIDTLRLFLIPCSTQSMGMIKKVAGKEKQEKSVFMEYTVTHLEQHEKKVVSNSLG